MKESDGQRYKTYLENFMQKKVPGDLQPLLPLVDAWARLLQKLPDLTKRNPARHCKITEFKNGSLLIDADHPGWLQILQAHERELLVLLCKEFPQLNIKALRFRLNSSELRPNVIEPEPQKQILDENEQAKFSDLISELEDLIRKKD